jgi:cytochrome c553
MQKASIFALAIVLVSAVAYAQSKPPMSAQASRGREIFLNGTKGVACGTCHSMAGIGTAIGPDLTNMASFAPPRGFVQTMHMSMTEYVQQVKTTEGAFPGMVKEKKADQTEVWDLSQMPPVLRTLPSAQIVSTTREQKWKHPPSTVEFTSQELADLIGFLKWAATGSVKEIKASDVE